MYLVLLLSILCPLARAEVTLRFQPIITPAASRLGDLLVIEKDTHHWSRLPLESHPLAGEIIRQEAIMAWMSNRFGPFKAHWDGKTHVVVKQVIQTTGKALVEKAQTSLIHQLQPHYTRVEVTPLSRIKDREYALDAFSTDNKQTFPTPKRVCVWLVHKNHKTPRIAVWFRVRAYAPVWVAKRDLRANTILHPDALIKTERNIAGLRAPPAQSVPNAHWLKSPLARKAILLESQLKAAPLVTHGQRLNVFTHHHGITVVMKAIALSDGYLGDTIAVKNPMNQKPFSATIKGFQQAEIAP